MLIRYILLIIASLIFMFVLSWKLTLVLLAVVPVVSIGAVVYGHYIKNLRKRFQDCLAEAGTAAEESISSIRTVRSFSNEDKSMMDYNKKIDKSYQVGKKSALAIGIFNGCVFGVIQGACVLVLWYGSTLVLKEELSPGLLTAFMLYMFNIAMAFAVTSSLYGTFMQAVGASIRIFQLLDRVPHIPIAGGEQLLMFEGSIEFQQVSFRYPSRPDTEVLKSISFHVERGTVVALVGPSGGGKSTIVSLIERFYTPLEGKICLGGCDVMNLDPKWFRGNVSMVGQEPVLFACTIRDNIAYGKDASQEEIEDVGKKANAHEFITNFEEGYDTLVGERGVRLSGGQKQRIAIARALLMNPTILLLDEATSALDAESEYLVQDAIDKAMVGRTVLIIAHRLSTVRNADKVLVVDKGVIAESGTHDQLLSQDGVYKKLVLRQLQAGQANDL
jgi:ABC-type multidrug transport system fused ATPase/permease subunit